MNIKKTLIIFLLLYLGFEFISIILHSITEVKILDNTFILLLTTMISCYIFIKINKRFFNKKEKFNILIGFILIDFLLQISALLLYNITEDIIFSIIIVLLIHSLAIYLFVSLSKIVFKKYITINEYK